MNPQPTTQPVADTNEHADLIADLDALESFDLSDAKPTDERSVHTRRTHEAPAEQHRTLRRGDVARHVGAKASANATHSRPPGELQPVPSTRRAFMRSPEPWKGSEPPLQLAYLGGFYGMNEVHPAALVHAMVLGGTSTGKTVSVIVPMMSAQLRYALPTPSGAKRMSMLLIDPKHELVEVAQRVLAQQQEPERLLHIGGLSSTPPIQFFADDVGLTPREKLAKLDVVMGTATLAGDHHGYWHTVGMDLVGRFLNLEDVYRARTSASLVGRVIRALDKAAPTVPDFWADLTMLLDRCATGGRELKRSDLELQAMLLAEGLNKHADAGVLSVFVPESDIQQFQYRRQTADPMLRLLADPEVAKLVDFDPFPTGQCVRLSLREAMDLGRVVAYQPEPRANSELVARALKALWYEAVTRREDLQRPVSVIVDEFQRFVTADAVTGDASFLDTARAFRANCLFATQSVAALVDRLGAGPGAQATVDTILANCPSKWYFASKDPLSEASVRAQLPPSPIGREHVVAVRPLALLSRGEAYWSLADGRWGRGRANRDHLL